MGEQLTAEAKPTLQEIIYDIWKIVGEANSLCDDIHWRLTGMCNSETKELTPKPTALYPYAENLKEEVQALRNRISSINKIV